MNNNNNNQSGNRFINNTQTVNSTNLDFNNNNIQNTNINQPPVPDANPSPIDTMNVEDSTKPKPVTEQNENQNVSNISYNETSINDLNVEGNYNKLEASTYSNDPVVRENIENHNKKTVKITVSGEMKFIIIICVVILIFIIIMPFIFDLVENIRFH